MNNKIRQKIASMVIYTAIFIVLYNWIVGNEPTGIPERFMASFMYVSFGGNAITNAIRTLITALNKTV